MKERTPAVFMQYKGNPWEHRHVLVVADIDERRSNLQKASKTCAERRKISLLKGVKIRKRFKEKVISLVDVGEPILWGHFKDEDCCIKRGRSNGDAW